MAKYVNREELPQFKLYNFCAGSDYGWDIGNDQLNKVYCPLKDSSFGDYIFEHKENGEFFFDDITDDQEAVLYGKPENAENVREKWLSENGDKSVSIIKSECAMLVNTMFKDSSTAELWRERMRTLSAEASEGTATDNDALYNYIKAHGDIIRFAMNLQLAQGFPIQSAVFFEDEGDFGENKLVIEYPKLVLINSKYYKKMRGVQKNIDYKLLYELLPADVAYVIVINGESAERKIFFILRKAGDLIDFIIMDPKNGISPFFIEMADDNSSRLWKYDGVKSGEPVIVTRKENCHPRGDYSCNGVGDNNVTCVWCNNETNCIHRTMDIAASVIYCFQEYLFKTIESRTDSNPETKKESLSGNSKEIIAAPYIPKGMVKLYDIKLSEEELRTRVKYESFSGASSRYPSTEKTPHVRRGTMRYNPKTGVRDIKVRSSIIHKEKYQGFISADRINE